MIFLISGGTHTGKTLLAQKLLEKYSFPYLSLDHLKMGLIRSGRCPLTPESKIEELTAFLWPIVREMIRTCLENGQNLIVEGCYIPFDYRKDFTASQLQQVRYLCLIFSETYIAAHYRDILAHASDIEQRGCFSGFPDREYLLKENAWYLKLCKDHDCRYFLIDGQYTAAEDLFV